MHRFRDFTVFVILVLTACFNVRAADDAKKPAAAKQPKFELRDGDRVVFLGNTLIERAQKYGYWETMLTARYPNKKITFRNLGWSGDTVWAESRGMFDPPAVGYKRMIEHVGRLKPTVIFVGYGNNEAFAGKEGLPTFIKQYNKLLDDLTRVSTKGVRFVLLSPAFVAPTNPPLPNYKAQHWYLQLYRNAVSEIAKKPGLYFVDLLAEMETKYRQDHSLGLSGGFSIDSNDPNQHHSERGMRRIGRILRGQLIDVQGEELFSPYDPGIGFKADGTIYARVQVSATNVKPTKAGLSVSLVCPRLPITELEFGYGGISMFSLGVSDLPPGKYEVRIDGEVWKTHGHVGLHEGIDVETNFGVPVQDADTLHGPNISQLRKLQEAIIAKNQLYFYRWRPQNITYLFGFRKHEQGQNAKELAQFDKLIAAKEAEINKLKKPVAHTYEIIRVKDKNKPAKKPAKP